MQTLRILGWLADFIVGSFIWAVVIALAALAAPFILIGFFLYEIFWNTKVFMFYLPLVPGLLVDMWYDVPVGRFFLCVLFFSSSSGLSRSSTCIYGETLCEHKADLLEERTRDRVETHVFPVRSVSFFAAVNLANVV